MLDRICFWARVSGAEVRISQNNEVNISTADALALCILGHQLPWYWPNSFEIFWIFWMHRSCLLFLYICDDECHPGGQYRNYYPGALSWSQVSAAHLKFRHPYGCLIFKWVAETSIYDRVAGWLVSLTVANGLQASLEDCCWLKIDCLMSSLCCCSYSLVNSLWASDTIWRHRSGSTLAQIMACCLMAPSYHLNQYWLLSGEIMWHSPESYFTEGAQPNNYL